MFRWEYKKCIHSFGEERSKKSWPLGKIRGKAEISINMFIRKWVVRKEG
jgi:hypothetical protein